VTGAGVKVCIVDTGVDEGHERHSGKVDGWVDFVSAVPSPILAIDDNGHGTHVASIVGGQVVDWQGSGSPNPDPNGDPFEGVAPDARLYVAKVLNAAGSGTNSAVVAGIDWCVAQAADIINLSLGGATCGDGMSAVSQAADAAVASGLTVVAAAGNSGDGSCTVTSPGDAFDVITVGALEEYSGASGDINSSDGVNIAWFSSRGPTGDNRPKPDLLAPGMSIMAAKAGTVGDLQSMSGTSMATPFVAGVAALMLESNPSLTPADIKDILACTAQDYNVAGPDNEVGAGAIDGFAAVQLAASWGGTCDPVDAIRLPYFVHLSDSVANSSEWTYGFEIADSDLGSPIAATVTMTDQVFVCDFENPFEPGCLAGHMSPDLDVELRYVRGDGVRITLDEGTCMGDADAKCGAIGRTETLNFRPTAQSAMGAGSYEIQVHGADDAVNLGEGGSFMLDLSYGLWAGAGGGGGGTPPGPSLTLSAVGYKVKGSHTIDLSWTGAASVDVYRDSDPVPIVANQSGGSYTDNTGNKGGGTYLHIVCDAGTDTCSNVTNTVF
jgi:serine protease AprX